MFRTFVLLSTVLTVAACGTYRSGSGGYQTGAGGFKTPSDYVPSVEGGYTLTDKLPQGQNYIPNGAFKLYWPVKSVRINRGFRPASDRNHQGIDLGGPRGTPILAAHEGVVIYAGRDFRGYGNMVLIEFDKEWATLYGHLHQINVAEGRIVRAGDPIGTMGRTGRASGVHLHFELIQKREPVDPLPHLTRDTSLTANFPRSKSP